MRESQPISKKQHQELILDNDDLSQAVKAWKEDPTAGHLGDILSFSIAPGCVEVVRQVAREALRSNRDISPPQQIMLKTLLDDHSSVQSVEDISGGASELNSRIRETRELFRLNPANPLVLLEFAQLQLAQGDARKSEKLIRAAKQFAPDSRLVIRTTARFLSHIGRSEEGHALLANHPRTKVDPWLMAAEIAMSQLAETPSRFVKVGARVIKDGGVPYAHLSELAGALGGVEKSSGNIRRAREYYRLALRDPNDNVMAQAVTDQRYLSLDASPSVNIGRARENPYEATALLAWEDLDYEKALRSGLQWHAEEPFSSRPLHFLTSFLSSNAKYEESVTLSRRGLVADSNDVGLSVNLSYALAALGKLNEAEPIARRIKAAESSRFSAQATATMGLIAMKRGDFVSADDSYLKALDYFEKTSNATLHAICRAYYARTAFDCGHPDVDKIISAAVDEYHKHPLPDAAFILKRLGEDVSDVKCLELRKESQRVIQWEFDKELAVLVKKSAMVESGSPLIINKPK